MPRPTALPIEEARKMTIDERMKWALDRGQEEVERLMAEMHVDRETAIRMIRRESNLGRRYSRCNDDYS